MDKINDRWGEFVITPALMMGMGDIILDRISFGGVKELEEIYLDWKLCDEKKGALFSVPLLRQPLPRIGKAGALWATGQPTSDQYSLHGAP
jgi:hypothetical protein